METKLFWPSKEFFDGKGENSPSGADTSEHPAIPVIIFTPKILPYHPPTVTLAGGVQASAESLLNVLISTAQTLGFGTTRKALTEVLYPITDKDLKAITTFKGAKGESVPQPDMFKTDSGGKTNSTTSSQRSGSDSSFLQIILPMKPIEISNQQNYGEENDAATGALNALPNAVAQGLSKAMAEALNQGDVLKTMMNNSGAHTFNLTRKFYSGTSHQSLTFSWDLIPKNLPEAGRIKAIVNLFRFLSMALSPPNTEDQSILVGRNPAVWNIKFLGLQNGMMKNSNEYPYMVCSNVTVGIGDGEFFTGFKTDNGYFPNIIKLSVTMEELFSSHSASDYFGDNFENSD